LCFPQVTFSQTDPPILSDSTQKDSISLSDSTQKDSISIDTVKISRLLEETINYNAKDSIRLKVIKQKVFLYGNAVVKFGEIELKAGYIEYDLKEKNVKAYPTLDSAGNKVQFPEFTDGNETFTAKMMAYNFETKKAYVEGSRSKQGEGFIHFDKIKVYPNKETHGRHGKYTTCDLEHPHYYFNISKAIIKPNNKIIAGPLMLYISDIPTPLALPFGFFPNQKRKGAGIIIPTYDNNNNWGVGFLNGGYYIPFGEKVDLQLTGSIYTKGTWSLRAFSRYKTRYKYSGNLQLTYQNNLSGSKDLQALTGYSKSQAYSIRWMHSQDSKARPNSSFRANVNYNSSARNDINQVGTGFLDNSYSSAIAYGKTFPNTPFSMNLTASQSGKYTHSTTENVKSYNSLTFNLPDVNFQMNRIYPLKKIDNEKTRGKKWAKQISKIYLTYNTQFQNRISFIDTAIDKNNYLSLGSQMRNGFLHKASTGTSFKVLKKAVTINPYINANERWYLQKLNKSYDATLDSVLIDTLRGIRNWDRTFDASFNVSATTKFYGMYQFSGFAKGKKKAMVRHVLTPSLYFSYNPNFSTLTDSLIHNDTVKINPYSPYALGILGYPPNSKSGLVTFSLANSLEMKIKEKTDTGLVYKKVKLIDNFTLRTSYDVLKEKRKMSNITASGRTTLFKIFTITGAMNFSPYSRDTAGVLIDSYLYKETKKIARLTKGNINLSFALSPETFKKKKKEENGESNEKEPESEYEIPWTANFSYVMTMSKTWSSFSNRDSAVYSQSAAVGGSINFTKNWRFGFNVNYDITHKDFSYSNIEVYRNLHCWEMKLSWVPFGPRQSYNFGINVKSAVLQDLKYEKKSQPKEFR
jgi:lipopolysaccharide export system protein LptA